MGGLAFVDIVLLLAHYSSVVREELTAGRPQEA
jgi:hypothetical protein